MKSNQDESEELLTPNEGKDVFLVSDIKGFDWDSRIRTYTCRDQNPMPSPFGDIPVSG